MLGALTDWSIGVLIGICGDGINGFIEALRRRQYKIKFILDCNLKQENEKVKEPLNPLIWYMESKEEDYKSN